MSFLISIVECRLTLLKLLLWGLACLEIVLTTRSLGLFTYVGASARIACKKVLANAGRSQGCLPSQPDCCTQAARKVIQCSRNNYKSGAALQFLARESKQAKSVCLAGHCLQGMLALYVNL
jgi:hypothetical protein